MVGKEENHLGSLKFYGRRSYAFYILYKREYIDKLREIQKDLDEIKAEFYNELGELKASHLESCRPLHLQRHGIVNGVIKDARSSNQEDTVVQGRGVPNFWLYALKGNRYIAFKITDQDEEALKYLKDIRWSRINKGFILEFHFDTNPFFENHVLTKTYHMNDEEEFFLESSIGTEITWRPGKCLTQKPSEKSSDYKSFFGLFSPRKIPANLIDSYDTVEILNLKFGLEDDCFLGLIIRDQIIPHALLWFTGEAALEDNTKISAQHSNFLKNLAKDVTVSIESLRLIHEKYDELKAVFHKDRSSIEAKYYQSCQTLYAQRDEIINRDETDEESIDPEADDYEEKVLLTYEKRVPNFWLYALQNNDYMDNEINYRDEQALEYLTNIKCSPIGYNKGFKLDFFFKINPFFENSVLTKTFIMNDEDRSIIQDITGTEIKWRPTRCLTQIPIRKKPKKRSKNRRSIITTEDIDSFFSFFSELEVHDTKKRTAQVRHDFYIGSIIRHQIIPHAVSWFTGEAIEKDELRDDDDQYLGLEYFLEGYVNQGEAAYEDLDDGLEYDYEHGIEVF